MTYPTTSQGFLLTQHALDIGGKPQIQCWVATDNGPVKLIIDGQYPLFFVQQSDLPDIEQALSQANIQFKLGDAQLKSFSLAPIATLYFNTIKDSRSASYLLKDTHIQTFESDLRLDQRFLMERFINGGLEFRGTGTKYPDHSQFNQVQLRKSDYTPKLNVLSLDIECSQHGELYSIGLASTNYERVIMIGSAQQGPDYIIWVDDEAALLTQLEIEIAYHDPDIIVGWNVINFDFRLLVKRANYHGKKLRIGRGQSFAHWRDSNVDNNGYITVPGRVVVDGIDSLKSATYQFASFSLDAVAHELLNRGKLSHNVHQRMDEINHNFRHDKVALAAYNLEDCRLVNDIFAHTKLLEYLVFRSKLTGLLLDRVGGSVAAFTNLYLPKLHRAGYIAPNLPANGGLASPGGYVMDSKPGLYNNVLVLDFKSLYPSIIRTFKIDPMGLIEGLANPDDAIEGFKDAKFSRENHFLPEIITDLWAQRDQAKRDNDAPRSQAIKIIMSSFYGVLGSGGCRFYDTRLASSITLRGHEIIQQTAQWIERDYQVIYGDTDSVFVYIGDAHTPTQAQEIGSKMAADINQRWQTRLRQQHQLECDLELEFETHYQKFLMPTIRNSEMGSKKRYAGLLTKGDKSELVFKGLESVRSDWTELARQFQQQLYQLVFDNNDPVPFILDTIDRLNQGQLDDQLIYKKRLRRELSHYVKNIPPQVKAARIADDKNAELGRPLQYQHKGSISYILTINGPEPIDYKTSLIDYQHYIDKQLEPIADGILGFIDLSFNQITNKQMGLF